MLRLKRPLRPDSNADPDDVLAVKRRLADYGFYEPPTGDFHPWPDAELFAGIEAFQKVAGETPDGEMLPGGPTEAALNRLAVPASEDQNAQRIAFSKRLLRSEEAISDSGTWRESVARQTGMQPTDAALPLVLAIPPAASALGEAGLALLPGLLGGAALILGQRAFETHDDSERSSSGAAFDALPPEKPEPYGGPSQEEIDRLNKELRRPLPGRPAEPIEMTPESFPSELPREPQILIFPNMSGEIPRTIVENRKGNDKTKAQIDRIRDWFLDRGWAHLHGGRTRHTNLEVPEFWVPSMARKFGDSGKLRGRFVDLTMKSPDGQIVHIQTVTVDENGKPIASELEAAEDIRRRTDAHVILVPKTWQVRGGRRGK